MITNILLSQKFRENINKVFLIVENEEVSQLPLSNVEVDFVLGQLSNKETFIHINRFSHHVMVVKMDAEKEVSWQLENARRAGDRVVGVLQQYKQEEVELKGEDAVLLTALTEGLALGNYQYLKYKSEPKESSLRTIWLDNAEISEEMVEALQVQVEGVYVCRNLVNEPVADLTAPELANRATQLCEEAGIDVEVFSKQKIESLKMGGLLAVNRGSIDPPAFIVMEWKPENATNEKPVVLVGKGVVFDTGGMNLKTVPGSIDHMKSDMGGAATVISTIYSVAKAKLPVHLVALVPATDNRVAGNAYVPGDIIEMFDGTKVEVLNTDAEGRMILADGLSYAKKYSPELVINVATLTGAAAYSIGSKALVGMGNASAEVMNSLKQSGMDTFERVAEMPFWEDYGELIKSEIADIKNLGGREAGAITAGKFLEHFTDYPFIHLDIAGPAYIERRDGYRTAGGTGVGVRLLFNFLNKHK
jgi:leucyl aminopeptidase